MVRTIAFGVISGAVILWLAFFAEGPGSVEVATLAAAAVALIWFATVDPTRLVGDSRRPQPMLFFLALVGLALLVTAAALIASTLTFLILGVGLIAVSVGFGRAVRHGIAPPPKEESDGVQ